MPGLIPKNAPSRIVVRTNRPGGCIGLIVASLSLVAAFKRLVFCLSADLSRPTWASPGAAGCAQEYTDLVGQRQPVQARTGLRIFVRPQVAEEFTEGMDFVVAEVRRAAVPVTGVERAEHFVECLCAAVVQVRVRAVESE